MATINKIAKSIKQSIQTDKSTSPYDTQATVNRIEGQTAWVQIPGGVDETPVKLTTSAKPGDVVQVRVSGGRAWLTGNASAPPTDDTRAIQAQTIATDASRNADIARNAAESAVASAASASASAVTAYNKAQEAATSATNAQTSANNALASATNAAEYASRALGNLSTVQSVAETLTWITQHGTMALTTDTALDPTHVYFIRDNNGDYQVGSYKYSIVSEPDVDDISTYYELTIDESLNNYVGTHLALTNEGLWLLPAASGTNKVLIATGAGSTYTTAGTYIIGSSGETLAKFSTNGLSVTTQKNNNLVEIANLGYGLGNADSGTAEAPYYTLGIRKSGEAIGNYSVAEGNNITASGGSSHAEGTSPSVNSVLYYLTASGFGSHAEGGGTTASGRYSHAEGDLTTASGDYSHAEGGHTYSSDVIYRTTASGRGSHAEGLATTAFGGGSHAEGVQTTAGSDDSSLVGIHAEGYHTTATGDYSHAQNYCTIAQGQSQTVIGKYNVAQGNPSSTPLSHHAFIIGNGTADNARSNALTVDWSGNVDIASGAKYKIDGTNLSASDVGAVPTSRTVNSKALSSNITLTASDVSAVALSDKYTRSSVGTLDWTNTTDGDAKVIAKSALAFWNGAYSGTSSNLAYCNKGAFGTLATKNSLSASDVGAVPTSRTVNSKALSSNITLSASDVGAFPKSNMTRGISMVSTIPSDGKLTLNNTDIGGSSSAKIQGVLAIPQYSNGVTVKHNYDASSTSQVVLNFYKADGSAYSGAMRYFLITFPNSWG